jgi:hypothetical protein
MRSTIYDFTEISGFGIASAHYPILVITGNCVHQRTRRPHGDPAHHRHPGRRSINTALWDMATALAAGLAFVIVSTARVALAGLLRGASSTPA